MTTTTPRTAREFVETMLRSSVEADQFMAERINDPRFREAHQHTAVNGLIAAYALQTLLSVRPEAAEHLAETLNHLLTAGDLGGPAYRTAKGLGFDPDQWLTEFNERAARRRAAAQPEGDEPA